MRYDPRVPERSRLRRGARANGQDMCGDRPLRLTAAVASVLGGGPRSFHRSNGIVDPGLSGNATVIVWNVRSQGRASARSSGSRCRRLTERGEPPCSVATSRSNSTVSYRKASGARTASQPCRARGEAKGRESAMMGLSRVCGFGLEPRVASQAVDTGIVQIHQA